METKAIIFARDVIMSCSRTLGDGDTLDAVRLLFNNEDLVHCLPDPQAAEPVSVRIQRADGSEKVLSENVLRHMNASLPQFTNDNDGEDPLNIKLVREMDVGTEQELAVTATDFSNWVPDWETLSCMRCSVQFKAWVRRHHCRQCGACICSSCSQHNVALLPAEGAIAIATASDQPDGSAVQRGRVCFMCFQKAVVADISSRKEATKEDNAAEGVPSATSAETATISFDSGSGDDAVATNPTSGTVSNGGAASVDANAEEPSEDEWPTVSVEMGSRYKICSQELTTLFLLDCRYVRQIRWSGVADAGRIMISVQAVTPP